MVDSMVVNRRSVLSGTLAVGGLVVSGCRSKPAGPAEDEPVVPWPAGDTLGIGRGCRYSSCLSWQRQPEYVGRTGVSGVCRQVNNDLAQQISEHPDRFRGFATLPLHDPAAAAEELRRCVGDLGFVGALIAGTFEGLFLDDARFDPILAAADAVDLPIYVHPGLPHPQVTRPYYFGDWSAAIGVMFSGPAFGWHAEAGIHVIRLILSGALDRDPGLKLLSGHWGEVMAFWLERLDETFALVRTGRDRDISDYYREQIWVTPSGMFNQHQLDHVLAELGAERIIYSEDFPYVKRDNVAEFLTSASLSGPQMHAIAHGNAEALLRI